VAAVAASLVALSLVPASADPTTPSAGQVAAAKAKAQSVAQQVGSMQARLAAANAKLEQLGEAVAAAGEDYMGALFRLDQAKAAAASAEGAAKKAREQVEVARKAVGRLAAAAYRGQGIGLGIGAFVAAESPEYVAESIATMSVLADRQTAVLDQMKAAKVVADVLDRQAAAALDDVSAATEAAAKAKAAVEAKAAQQQSQVAGLNSQVTSLTAALAKARASSAALTKARKDGLARAAAARAAAAKKAREEAARAARASHGSSSGSSGSSGGSSSSGGSDTASHTGTVHATTAGAAKAIAFAKEQLGDPYLWAATGPDRWDCSGLTMRAWQQAGVNLPHWSVAQWVVSTPVSRSQARPGDLVFYAYNQSDYRTIHHVALYLGGGLVIEAPYTGANVRISSVDRNPVFGFARP
jgi:cell wall-associated NlpC family hydrolase